MIPLMDLNEQVGRNFTHGRVGIRMGGLGAASRWPDVSYSLRVQPLQIH